jgi:hypothetical protein
MRIEIDQSGRIEYTSKPTMVAFSNSKSGLIIILSREKKLVQKYFRQIGKPRLFAYLTFAAGIYLLIRNVIKNRDQLIIDREYPGYEKFISQEVKKFILKKSRIRDISISTSQIGKNSKAHDIAWHATRYKRHRIGRKVSARELIKLIKGNLKSGSI